MLGRSVRRSTVVVLIFESLEKQQIKGSVMIIAVGLLGVQIIRTMNIQVPSNIYLQALSSPLSVDAQVLHNPQDLIIWFVSCRAANIIV